MRLHVAVALWLAALATSLTADDAVDATAIRAATRHFVEAFNARDVEGLLQYYADGYLDLNLPEPRQSAAERRRHLSRILARGDTRLDVTADEVVVTGALAVVRGTILLSRTLPDGSPSSTRLRYMELMRRFPAGWKAIWGIDAELYPEPRDEPRAQIQPLRWQQSPTATSCSRSRACCVPLARRRHELLTRPRNLQRAGRQAPRLEASRLRYFLKDVGRVIASPEHEGTDSGRGRHLPEGVPAADAAREPRYQLYPSVR